MFSKILALIEQAAEVAAGIDPAIGADVALGVELVGIIQKLIPHAAAAAQPAPIQAQQAVLQAGTSGLQSPNIAMAPKGVLSR